ncbi:MAG: ATP-dependent Clp protease proteolytic subunit [Bacteroidota bacterium]
MQESIILYYEKLLSADFQSEAGDNTYIMGKNSGHSWKEIEEFFRRDRFMNSLEAKEYGFVDEVLGDTSILIKMDNKDPDVSFYGDKKK